MDRRKLTSTIKKIVLAFNPRPSRLGIGLYQLSRLGRWSRENNLEALPHFTDRFKMFEYLSKQIAAPIDYLEFGVFTGNSMRKWVELSVYGESRFYGFDTFTGLPEPWNQTTHTLEAGYFSTHGRTPDINDSRVHFIAGMFQESLDPFLQTWKARNRMVIHLDADLYSATMFPLCTLYHYLRPGTIVLFDEFGSVNHEFRAYMDFTAAFPVRMKPIAWAGDFYMHMALEVQHVHHSDNSGRSISHR